MQSKSVSWLYGRDSVFDSTKHVENAALLDIHKLRVSFGIRNTNKLATFMEHDLYLEEWLKYSAMKKEFVSSDTAATLASSYRLKNGEIVLFMKPLYIDLTRLL